MPATVFMDPLAMTFPDPDHSVDEDREITIGHTMDGGLVLDAPLRAPTQASNHKRSLGNGDRAETV
jgi:hypothetical protein